MEIKNCRKCGKMFNYMDGPRICQGCKAAIEKKFQEVKDFVRDNRTASVAEICEQCDVESKQVQQWIREERLIFADDSPVKISCEKCGAQIKTGRYCDKCKKDTMNNLTAAGRRPEAPVKHEPRGSASHKMHTFNG